MKIGKVTLGVSILALSLFTLGCKKKEPNVEPVADTETQSAVDAAWATYVITDIDQICAFMGEDQFLSHFYIPAVAGQNNYELVRDTSGKQKALTWRNGPVLCLDGRQREGSIFMYYKKDPISNPDANANSRYYRDFGFVGNLAFQDYKVDGWQVNLFNPAARAYIYNKMTTDKYDPTTERLTWLIAGKFLITHPTDPSKNIVWDGRLYKVLTNSTDKDIFNPNKQVAINWVNFSKPAAPKGAILNYYGVITGSTSATIPFSMTIDPLTPLVRDFLCTGDPISSVSAATSGTATVFTTNKEEHHPFISGIASFTTGAASQKIYPRQIYFGNEGTPDQPVQCDNTGVVLIQGNSYPVNFRK
jgi:hypothetical protein